MPKFIETQRPTPFGYYDSDPLFQVEADSMVTFVLRSLGESVLGVELTKKDIWCFMERATKELNALFVEYQAKSNLANLLGMPTGSIDTSTGIPTINLSSVYVQQNLSFLEDLAAPYAASIGYGSAAESYSGSIVLSEGVQDYDLYADLKDGSGTPIYNLQPSGSVTRLNVYEVYHFAPVQYVFNSNLASNFVAAGIPVESYIPDTRFYVLPLFEDVLRAGMLKEAQKVRRSHYSYRISGRSIRIFPAPKNVISGLNDKLWIRVGFRQSPVPQLQSTLLVSGASGTTGAGTNGSSTFQNDVVFGVNSPFNMPYGPIAYKTLNIWARNWIANYTLALCMEEVGRVRGKFKDIPIGGDRLQLDGGELVQNAREDKEKLFTALRETLDSLSYDKIAEREANKAEQTVKQLSYVPIPPRYAINLW